jgi:hypothetical protein
LTLSSFPVLEQQAKFKTKVVRVTSSAERDWLVSLVQKYDDDIGKMARDRKANVWQRTPGELKRMCVTLPSSTSFLPFPLFRSLLRLPFLRCYPSSLPPVCDTDSFSAHRITKAGGIDSLMLAAAAGPTPAAT